MKYAGKRARANNEAERKRLLLMWVSTAAVFPAIIAVSIVFMLPFVPVNTALLVTSAVSWGLVFGLGAWVRKLWTDLDKLEDQIRRLRLLSIKDHLDVRKR